MPDQRPPAVDPELRAATLGVLRERGWDGLTLERVAEKAGRARSTLWRQGLTREALIHALAGELAADFQAAMYGILTGGGRGRERLERGLAALCELVDRHMPLMLATDEAFHQETAPGQPPDYLHPFIRFIREGIEDGSLAPRDDPVAAADVLFNAVVWTYVHLRGRHKWPAERAQGRVAGLVLNGAIAGDAYADAKAGKRRSAIERSDHESPVRRPARSSRARGAPDPRAAAPR
jgi:AcrR family transcriptional regulator